MDYIIIFTSIIIIILLSIMIMKISKMESHKEKSTIDLFEEINDIKNMISSELTRKSIENIRDMSDLKDKINMNIMDLKDSVALNMSDLKNTMNSNLFDISNQLNNKLESSLNKTNKAFESLLIRMAKIDEAQKNIDNLGHNIVSLQDILTDKKTRGNFGEVQLYNILTNVFGDNSEIFESQYKLSNGTIVDSILHLPEPTGNICIDSKFPLENYRKSVDRTLSNEERKSAEKLFKINLKKHIDDISSKYIIANETSHQAIMFIPAEAIFAEINAYYQDIIDIANEKKVWIASPTTLMAVLNTTQLILKNIEREKYANIIQTELSNLNIEFQRYRNRWNNLSKDIDKVSKDVKDIHITSEKIECRFNSISNVDLKER